MRVARRLALIGAGYGLAFAGACAAVAVNEWRMPADVAQGSPGMTAFGDVVLFLLAAGALSLAPTWFLLKLALEKAPRAVLAAELAAAGMGPLSWIAVIWLAAAGPAGASAAALAGARLLGPLVALGAIPRIVLGPVVLAIEAATFLLVPERRTRALLAAAMLMDLVPLGLFALHMAGAVLRA
ncbi:MAG: hypothetical protein JO127_03430 [Caulobacteraceae bacterium]|nr:hypothetical protein [Caulobacteraceae bacterium]